MPEELPEHLREVVTPAPERASPTAVATGLALELDGAMQEIYETARQRFEANILANCPIILGLFSGEGGSFTLYRPGSDPVEAPPPPHVGPDHRGAHLPDGLHCLVEDRDGVVAGEDVARVGQHVGSGI